MKLTEHEKIKLIAKQLKCPEVYIKKAIAREDSYYRSYGTLRSMTTIEQVTGFYYETCNSKIKALRCQAAIKKIYELLWPGSAQETIQKDGVSNETK
ncbi:MAG: hypothetical protein WCP11_02680 [Candidatus Saccharibacteria bacterium]